jgi:hypothetical protein
MGKATPQATGNTCWPPSTVGRLRLEICSSYVRLSSCCISLFWFEDYELPFTPNEEHACRTFSAFGFEEFPYQSEHPDAHRRANFGRRSNCYILSE